MSTVEVRGLDALLAKLAAVADPDLPRRGMERAVRYTHGTVPPYPAPPPNSTYRRTGLLGRSITTEVRSLGAETVGVIGSNTIYAPDVISDEPTPDGRGPQARIHRGRWWTLQGVIRKARPEIVAIIRDEYLKVLR